MNKLEQLKQMTTVVADTGELEAIKTYQPVDATTNPSLLLKACAHAEYQPLLKQSAQWAHRKGGTEAIRLNNMTDHLAVSIGCEILKHIPGRVSSEVDAQLSFDTNKTIERARRLIHLYQQQGIDRDRILIKIASTWEGIRAAEVLQREGIQCNLTLLFSFAQAVACADARVFLISPFVGRILDWYKQHTGRDNYPAEEDPGVLSVSQIYHFFKYFEIPTIVMGASFRNVGEIEQLAGCDRLTISPQLMNELQQDDGHLPRRLSPDSLPANLEPLALDEARFRWLMNEDAMATDKLAEGIRRFAEDQVKLEEQLAKLV